MKNVLAFFIIFFGMAIWTEGLGVRCTEMIERILHTHKAEKVHIPQISATYERLMNECRATLEQDKVECKTKISEECLSRDASGGCIYFNSYATCFGRIIPMPGSYASYIVIVEAICRGHCDKKEENKEDKKTVREEVPGTPDSPRPEKRVRDR